MYACPVVAGARHTRALARRPFFCRSALSARLAALGLRPARRRAPRRSAYASAAASTSDSGSGDSASIAVVGAGFAGLSVVFNLLEQAASGERIGRPLRITLFDPAGIGSGTGGGGSQVAGGLLHGYTPRGKPMWMRDEALRESARLLQAAREAVGEAEGRLVARQGGIVRPAFSPRQEKDFRKAGRPLAQFADPEAVLAGAGTGAGGCGFGVLPAEEDLAWLEPAELQRLAPGLFPLRKPAAGALFIRSGATVDSRRYLAALWAACRARGGDRLQLVTERLAEPLSLASQHDAVVLCTGAFSREALGGDAGAALPFDVVKGHVVEFEGEGEDRELVPGRAYPASVISGKYIGFQAAGRADCGATFETAFAGVEPEFNEHVAGLLAELQDFYPDSAAWIERTPRPTLRAGLRAVPPRLAESGSTPLAGPVGGRAWLLAGLGSRGLFHAGWLGRRLAAAVLEALAEGGGDEAVKRAAGRRLPLHTRVALDAAGTDEAATLQRVAHWGRPQPAPPAE